MKEGSDIAPRLLRKRDFSEVFDDLGRFVRTSSSPFIEVLAKIAGPFLLLMLVLSLYLGMLSPGSELEFSFISVPVLIFFMLLAVFSSLLILGTSILYLKNLEKNDPDLSVTNIRRQLSEKAASIFVCFIAWVGIMLVFFFAVGLLVGSLMALFGALAPILAPFILLLAMLFVGPPMVFVVNASFFAMLRDDLPFGEAFTKAWRMLFTSFWKTWAVMMVGMILFWVLSFSLMIPEGLFTGLFYYLSLNAPMEGLSGYFLSGLGSLRFMAQQVLAAFFIVFQGMHYYSLHEIQQGEGLVQRFGQDANRE